METEVKGNMDFDQLVRIFVDTDVDTHFIVSASRSSTITELRELVKTTHRHCYPDSGDVNIGKLAVPGGEYGYHLADYLRIGQVYDKWDGKVFAEVEHYTPSPRNGHGLLRLPPLSYRTSPTPKKLHLLPDSNNGSHSPEKGAEQIDANVSKEYIHLDSQNPLERNSPDSTSIRVKSGVPRSQKGFKVPKSQQKKLSLAGNVLPGVAAGVAGREDSLLESQAPFTKPPGVPSDLPVDTAGSSGEEDANELEERPGSFPVGKRIESIATGKAVKLPRKKKKERVKSEEMCLPESHVELEKVPSSQVAMIEEVLRPDSEGGSKKRDAPECSQRLLKKRKLTEPTPSDSTLKKGSQNGDVVKKDGVNGIEKDEKLEVDHNDNDVKSGNDFSGNPNLQSNPCGGFSVSILSGAGKKRRKKKGIQNADLVQNDGSSEIVKTEKLGIDHRGDSRSRKDLSASPDPQLNPDIEVSTSFVSGAGKTRKKRRELDTGLINGSELNENTLNSLAAAGEEEPDTSMGGCETLVATKAKGKKKGKKGKGIAEKASTSMGSGQEESNQEAKLKVACFGIFEVDPARSHLAGTLPSANLENLDTLVKVGEDDTEVIKGKKKKKGKKKRSTSASGMVDNGSTMKGTAGLERPLVDDGSEVQVFESQTPIREARILKETSREEFDKIGMTANRPADMDDKALMSLHEHIVDGGEIGKSTPHEVGAEAFSQTKVEPPNELARNNAIEKLESPHSSRPLSGTKAGRGAPSETSTHESSGDEKEKEKRPGGSANKAAEGQSQSSKSSGKRTGKSEGRSLGPRVSASSHSQSKAGKQSRKLMSSDGDSLQGLAKLESSGEIKTGGADQTELGSQLRAMGSKEDKELMASQSSHASRSVKSPERQVNTSENRAEGEEEKMKINSLEAYSQDQSFHVTPTQVGKALSGSTTEESDDGSDNEANEGMEKLEKQEASDAHPSPIEDGKSEESSDESGDSETSRSSDSASMATRTPAPRISRITSTGGSQSIKRRASGMASDVEAKFAQFIDSQDGLDEFLGITLSQRKRSIPVEPSKQAGLLGAPSTGTTVSPAAASSSPVDVVSATHDSIMDNLTLVDRGLGNHKVAAVAQVPEKLVAKSSTPEFKVPKPVPVNTLGAMRGGVKSADVQTKTMQSLEMEWPSSSASKALPTKKKESLEDMSSKKEKQVEKVMSIATREGSLQPPSEMDVHSGSIAKEKSADLSSTPQGEKERVLDYHSAAEDSQRGSEKSSEKGKKLIKKKEDLQFMVVNNIDHVAEEERESKKSKSKDEKNGTVTAGVHPETTDIQPGGGAKISPGRAGVEEKGTSHSEDKNLVSTKKSGKKHKDGKVKREDTRLGLNGSPDISALESSGKKKKKKKKKFTAEELEGNELNLLPETSVDRSVRETEELYLKLEKANRDLWLQNIGSSVKKEKEVAMSGGNSAAEGDDSEVAKVDVAQSTFGLGEIEVDDTDSKRAPATGDIPVGGERDGGDIHENSHLYAGNTEASDREEDAFPTQDVKEPRPEEFQVGGDERRGSATDDKVERQQQKETETTLPSNFLLRESGDVFDFVSGDERPTTKVVKAAEKSGKRKAKRMEEVSDMAVARVLEDEMLHVADPDHVPGKKQRKDAKPQKWTVRMRGAVPSALAAPLHGVPTSSMGEATSTKPTCTGGSTDEDAEALEEAEVDEGLIKAENLEETAIRKATKTSKAATTTPKRKTAKAAVTSGVVYCPAGCGKAYSGKTSAWYTHKKNCTGAPLV